MLDAWHYVLEVSQNLLNNIQGGRIMFLQREQGRALSSGCLRNLEGATNQLNKAVFIKLVGLVTEFLK